MGKEAIAANNDIFRKQLPALHMPMYRDLVSFRSKALIAACKKINVSIDTESIDNFRHASEWLTEHKLSTGEPMRVSIEDGEALIITRALSLRSITSALIQIGYVIEFRKPSELAKMSISDTGDMTLASMHDYAERLGVMWLFNQKGFKFTKAGRKSQQTHEKRLWVYEQSILWDKKAALGGDEDAYARCGYGQEKRCEFLLEAQDDYFHDGEVLKAAKEVFRDILVETAVRSLHPSRQGVSN